MSFHDATAVQPIDDDGEGRSRFAATIHDGWDIAGNANGGYLLSILARAVIEATGKPDPITITGHYLAPGRPGEVTIEVVEQRSGRRHSTASATLVLEGRTLLVALATTADLATADGPERIDSDPPELPDPDACVPVVATSTFPPPFMSRVELRLHPDDAGFMRGERTGRPRIRGWFRLPGGESLGSLGLLLATDAFPPTIFNADLPVAWTPTVELTAHVRARPPDGWLRCSFATRFIMGGYLESDGEIWTGEGRLIAQSRQLALVPRA